MEPDISTLTELYWLFIQRQVREQCQRRKCSTAGALLRTTLKCFVSSYFWPRDTKKKDTKYLNVWKYGNDPREREKSVSGLCETEQMQQDYQERVLRLPEISAACYFKRCDKCGYFYQTVGEAGHAVTQSAAACS